MSASRIAAIALVAVACKFDIGNFDDRRCVKSGDCLPEEACSPEGLCTLRGCMLDDDCSVGASCGYQFRCDTNVCIRQGCTIDTECRAPYGCDNGFCAAVCVAFDSPSGSRAEAGSIHTAVVAVSPIAGRDVTFTVSSTNDTAIEDRDYTVSADPFVIPAGEASLSVPVTLIDNPFLEPDKSFSLTLVNPMPAILGEPSTHVVTITNDDEKHGLMFDPNQTDVAIPEGSSMQNFQYRVVLTGAAQSDVVFMLDTNGSTAGIGGGNADAQFQTPMPITIPTGQMSAVYTLRINGDNDVEMDETVMMRLVLVSGDVIVSQTPRIHTIVNDD